MKQKTRQFFFLLLFLTVSFFACKDKEKKDEAVKTEETKADAATQPGFDAAMDATKVSGYPARVLGDSLGVKAYEFVANPGDSIPMHSHPDHMIYVLEGGKAEIKGSDGNAQVADFVTGACMISGPQSHSAKNIGTTTLKLLIVHLYRPRN